MGVDTQSIWKTCLRRKNVFLLAAAIATVVAVVVSVSTPSVYKSRVMLAVEWSAPMNVLVGANEYADEILQHDQVPSIVNDPFVYTKILKSQQLIDTIRNMSVTTSDGEVTLLGRHVEKCFKCPWWERAVERSIDDIIRDRLKNEIKLKTGLIIVQYEDEDALVSSQVVSRMTAFLDDYFKTMNSERAEKDVAFYRQQQNQQRKAYEEALRKYSAFHDSHFDVSSRAVQNELEYLRDESEKRHAEYSKASVMLKRAEMRAQQQLLVAAELKTMPTYRTGGARMWIVNIVVALFYALLFSAWWVLLRRNVECRV